MQTADGYVWLGTQNGLARFDGVRFTVWNKVQLRYKLDGFDRDWAEAGTRRAAFYTNILPGDYRFRVMACNSDGV